MDGQVKEFTAGILSDVVEDDHEVDLLSDPARFENRELSWLEFNRRVLEEVRNPRNPLLERVRFLSISASNLDEFLMVRVAGLMGQVSQNVSQKSDDGLTPKEQLEAIRVVIDQLQHDQLEYWKLLQKDLASEQIHIADPEELEGSELAWLEDYFLANLFPVLTPLSMDLAHPFPFIPNLGHSLVFDLEREADNHRMIAYLRLPDSMQRFIELPSQNKTEVRFVRVEEVIERFIATLFPGHVTHGFGNFRVIRDSDLEVEEEAEDLVLTFETALKRRRRGTVI